MCNYTTGLPEAETLASDCSIDVIEAIVTDSSPGAVVVDFQTSFVRHSTAYQSYCW